MKFHPILFSTEMVKAILEGRKTQTRRVVKINGVMQTAAKMIYTDGNWHGESGRKVKFPYGNVGDVLWVRESWQHNVNDFGESSGNFFYKASEDAEKNIIGWKPSIHIPKAACRLFLKIKNISVERLQDITRGDCMAEGCPFPNIAKETDPKRWFSELWQSINGKESWNANPWVWVIEFEQINKPENFR